MSTSMNKNSQDKQSTVGLLLIIGNIISNEQREEICIYLQQAFKQINNNKYYEINDIFNNLIHENEFQADCQYRQIANTENGSMAGFLYLPSFHTLLNVLKDLFNTCYHVCMIFCGQQIDFNGDLILSDSIFTCDNFHSLFNENPSYLIKDLQIILPFISNEWKKLLNNSLQKYLENIQINDLSSTINEDHSFGHLFYERLIHVLNKNSFNFDIYAKLISRDSSGTIAFDEPNLYILYGQQGEASLFGIRGFVVLVNGGYSRIPSYWNLIRGLQNIDACILTHFDYDVFPGLQTILHRKTISSLYDNQLCKPDIGVIFLNHIQRMKLQSIHLTKSSSSSNNKLLVNLNENINEFLNNIKQLNIDTIDLVKNKIDNKSNIEPINLYKKIAFGSLDLYILHPTTSISEDEKILTTLQKIPIHGQQPSSSIIPFHHWYSSCSLLVWTPNSKSNKDSLVRILYTGACPQTLVFEALDKVRHLEFLHESQHQQMNRSGNIKKISPANTSLGVKHPPQKPKVSPSLITNRVTPSTTQNKTAKVLSHSTPSKPKFSQTTPIKPGQHRSTTTAKKTSPSTATSSARPINKDKKVQKSNGIASKNSAKPKQIKSQNQQEQKLAVEIGHKEESETHNDHEQKLEVQNSHEEELKTHYDHEERQEVLDDHDEKLEIHNEHQEELLTENENEQNLEIEINHEKQLDIENHEKLNDIEQKSFSQNDHEEQTEDKNEHKTSTDQLNENNDTSINNHEDEMKQPESVPLTNDHNESLIQSNSSSPIEEIKSESDSYNPMITGFIDGTPDTQNPFANKTNDDDYDDDEMEIIQHDISTSNTHPIPSNEDINPQGLPIENNIHSKKPTMKKPNNNSNKASRLSTSSNTMMNQTSSHKSKQSDSIFNVDVAYIPYHGNEHYVDSEFFRRIRARYYILNAVQINRLTLESLIDGKQQWENKEHVPVTLVPTFDGEQLRQFFIMNKNRLAELNINILPASTRCNVQYDDEGSPAQRLRFSSLYNTDEQ